MAKKNDIYFSDFLTMIEYSCEAAEYLQKVFSSFDNENMDKCREHMHKIENAADDAKHGMMGRLVKEFVTPIDREDILELANELDDITDKIEDILIRVYMYNVQAMLPEALSFADVIVRCCRSLKNAVAGLPEFRKAGKLKEALIEVNSLEEEGDQIYIEAVRKLYTSGMPSIEIIAWSKLFERLEDCCDACEHAADVIETIIMKNS